MKVSASARRLDADRIRALAEAFGAEPSRWPEADRAAALAWLEAHPGEGAVLLAEARALDGLLEAWRLPQPAEPLRQKVLGPAPVVVRLARRRSFLMTLGGGAGLAAACLAGVMAAPILLATPAPTPSPAPPAVAATPVGADELLTEALAGWEAPVGEGEADAAS